MSEIILLKIYYDNDYYYKSELGSIYDKTGKIVGTMNNNDIYIFDKVLYEKPHEFTLTLAN